MTRYFCLLRTVNAPGQPKISMPALRALFQQLGYEKVQSHLRSGNLIFSTETPKANHARVIEAGIEMQFDHKVPVVLIPDARFTQLADTNPLLQGEGLDEDDLHVTFLSATVVEPIPEDILPKARDEKAILHLGHYCLYLHAGQESTRIHNDYFESTLKTPATTRDWKTVLALARLLEEQHAPKSVVRRVQLSGITRP